MQDYSEAQKRLIIVATTKTPFFQQSICFFTSCEMKRENVKQRLLCPGVIDIESIQVEKVEIKSSKGRFKILSLDSNKYYSKKEMHVMPRTKDTHPPLH